METPPKTIETTTSKKVVNKASLSSLKSALSSLEADYKNNKDGTVSKRDIAWYNNILGITTPSEWITSVGEIRIRLQNMI